MSFALFNIMEGKDVINAILAHECINAAQLCQQIGLVGSKTQALYDTLRGKTQKVSPRIANLIRAAKPMYRLEWLLTGDGDMLDESIGSTATVLRDKQAEQVDSLTIINHLININAQKDEEIRELRKAYEHLASAFEKLANRHMFSENEIKKSI